MSLLIRQKPSRRLSKDRLASGAYRIVEERRKGVWEWFGAQREFAFRYLCGLVTPKKVEGGMAGSDRALPEALRRVPDGLNSHEHLHNFPSFFRVFIGLAEK